MKRLWKRLRRGMNYMAVLLAAVAVVTGACSTARPVPARVTGVVTGKHQIEPKGNPPESKKKEKPRYFLWVKTEDGMAYVEVTGKMFRSVTKGEQVCINCEPTGPSAPR